MLIICAGFFDWESLSKITASELNTMIFELGIRPDTSPVLASLPLAQLPSESPVEQRRRRRFAREKPTFTDRMDTILVPEINAMLTRLNVKLITTVELLCQTGLKLDSALTIFSTPSLSNRAEKAVKELFALLVALKHYCDHQSAVSSLHFEHFEHVFTLLKRNAALKLYILFIF